MIVDSPINASNLNAGIYIGENWLGFGGFEPVTSYMSTQLRTYIRLQGGVISYPALGGDVVARLIGGTFSNMVIGGSLFWSPKLIGGMRKTSSVFGDIHWAPKLSGSVIQLDSVGGQLVTHISLKSKDTVGSNSSIYTSNILFGSRVGLDGCSSFSGVYGDFKSNKYRILYSGINKIAALDGLLKIVNKGLRLKAEGTYSSSSIGGGYKKSARFTNSKLSSNSNIGSFIKVQPKFFSGVQSTSSLDTSSIHGGRGLNGGLISFNIVRGAIKQSLVVSFGPINSGTLGGKYRIDAMLHPTVVVFKRSKVGDTFLRISSGLQGGNYSNSQIQTKYLITNIVSGGIYGNNVIGGNSQVSAILTGNIRSDSLIRTGDYHITALLSKGVFSTISEVDGRIIISSTRVGGFTGSINFISALYKISAKLLTTVGNTGTISRVSGQLKLSPKLTFALSNSTTLSAKYLNSCILSKGVQGNGSINSQLLLTINLQGAIYSSSTLSAKQVLSPILRCEVFSSNMIQGFISGSFIDPNLNTWAIYLKSATQQLTILTPKQDT
jgi:hypothetical protein